MAQYFPLSVVFQAPGGNCLLLVVPCLKRRMGIVLVAGGILLKKIILAPDSFKGTLSAQEVCRIEKKVLTGYFPEAKIECIPMADGGEGMVDAYLNILGGRRNSVTVNGPLGNPITSYFGILPDGSAVIEMAAAAGLPLVKGRENPLYTSTYGVGEMIAQARRDGIGKILLGLGGSCTNDCGVGMASALGFRFLGKDGMELEARAYNLHRIYKIVEPDEPFNVEIYAACDVSNPLIGPNGATYTFGPQKGADQETLDCLERGVAHFAEVLSEHYGYDCTQIPGAGAAGGMGAAVRMMLNGTLKSGIELLLDATKFDSTLEDADLVITGEGRVDWQSAFGKVVSGVGERCKKKNVPCIALGGSVGKGVERVYEHGITAVFSSIQNIATFDEVKNASQENLERLIDSVARLLVMKVPHLS